MWHFYLKFFFYSVCRFVIIGDISFEMKKNKSLLLALSLILSGSTLLAGENPLGLHVSSEIIYESEYVHRGRKLGQTIFSTTTDCSYPIAKGSIHFGLRSRTELENSRTSGTTLQNILGEQFEASFDTFVPYIRYEHNSSETFSATIGYMHYYYPKMHLLNESFYRASHNTMKVGLKDHTNEIFISAWANVIFRPTICMFYNFDCKEFLIMGHLFLKYDLDKIGLANSYILVDTYLGFDHANKPYGIEWKNKFWYKNPYWGTINGQKGYIYGGIKTNLVYSINEHAKIKTGINFEANGNTGMSWTNFTGWASHKGVKRMLWYTLAAECSF